ncbi:uncharacterized protein LOC132035073 [Lycium ferocissimum]|uniref:uncharacterized protein LOC132035073 n=1 Tax=Lycium ferocissimum TaxID=112874 RepID=UPI0028153E88|nr:uncharacterized protein LOC132035073 [Lycium ferocissimum]
MATSVGKPLTIDLDTTNRTRPSYAKVKVEVDLFAKFAKRINIAEEDDSGIVTSKWVNINYDYLPKYCKHCILQGHEESEWDANKGGKGWFNQGKQEWMQRRNKYIKDKSGVIIGKVDKVDKKEEENTMKTSNAFAMFECL